MAKRRNENGQMRREEYEAADDDDRFGGVTADSFSVGFERASDSSIKQRKIVKARIGGRPPAKPAAPAPSPAAAKAPAASSTNPFGGFQGLTASQPVAASANPFAGFAGLTSAPPASPSAAPVALTSSAMNGASTAASAGAKTYQEAMEALNKEFLAFVNSQARESPSVSWVAAVKEYLAYADAIGAKHASTRPVPLEQQNKKATPAPFSFAPMPSAPLSSSVTTPKSPANGSLRSATPSSAAKPKETSTPAFSAASTSSFSFGSTDKASASPATAAPSFSFASSKKDSTATTPTASSFSFGSSTKSTESAKETPSKEKKDSDIAKPGSRFGGFSFGGNSSSASEETKTIPAFSFGAAPVFPPTGSSSTAATSSGFTFGGLSSSAASPSTPSATLPPSSKPFSFAAASSTAGASGTNEDEDEENIGREEATVILKSGTPEEDDCTFEVEKAKVLEFKKDEKRWADKGVHPLQVLVDKKTKSGRVLIRNEIGKIVLNAALYKGIKLKPYETKGKKTGVLLSLQVDAAAGLTQFILKVNAAKVDDLIASLDKAANGASS